MKYVELTKANVSQDVLEKFDCGHPDFNDFLKHDAVECAANGNGVRKKLWKVTVQCLIKLRK